MSCRAGAEIELQGRRGGGQSLAPRQAQHCPQAGRRRQQLQQVGLAGRGGAGGSRKPGGEGCSKLGVYSVGGHRAPGYGGAGRIGETASSPTRASTGGKGGRGPRETKWQFLCGWGALPPTEWVHLERKAQPCSLHCSRQGPSPLPGSRAESTRLNTWGRGRGAGKGGGPGGKKASLKKEGRPWVGGEPRSEERPGQSRCTGQERGVGGGPWGKDGGSGEGGCM